MKGFYLHPLQQKNIALGMEILCKLEDKCSLKGAAT